MRYVLAIIGVYLVALDRKAQRNRQDRQSPRGFAGFPESVQDALKWEIWHLVAIASVAVVRLAV
jgi:hypothetical protein